VNLKFACIFLSRRVRRLRMISRTLQRRIMGATGLFDADYYLGTYPDVVASRMDPLSHYCEFGWREKRRPGPFFAPELANHRVSTGSFPVNPALAWWLLGRWLGQSPTYPEVLAFAAQPPSNEPIYCDVAFVLHECTRTGAPLFSIGLARWLRDIIGLRIRFIILSYGPLLESLSMEFDCILLDAIPIAERENRLRTELSGRCRSLYFNSIASLVAVPWLSWFSDEGIGGSVIVHCHESPEYIKSFKDLINQISSAKSSSCQFISVTKSSATALSDIVSMMSIPVTYLPPAVAISSYLVKKCRDPTLIIGCGTASLRKGADLFCRTARQMLDSGFHDFRMVWIGGSGDANLTSLIRELEIASHVSTVGEIVDPRSWYERASLLFMGSREDPFPLACLEAAERELPTICFDSLADGIGRFARPNTYNMPDKQIDRLISMNLISPQRSPAAAMVPAFDVDAMAAAIINLLKTPWHLAAMGAAARRRVEVDHDLTMLGERILQFLPQTSLSDVCKSYA
jgi:glycosyltransferase involved in cell wall biosynthesis